jgi:hypothetical protein
MVRIHKKEYGLVSRAVEEGPTAVVAKDVLRETGSEGDGEVGEEDAGTDYPPNDNDLSVAINEAEGSSVEDVVSQFNDPVEEVSFQESSTASLLTAETGIDSGMSKLAIEGSDDVSMK